MTGVVVNPDGSSETTYEYVGVGTNPSRTLIKDALGTPVQLRRDGDGSLFDIVTYVD